jgi:hypothetical protein
MRWRPDKWAKWIDAKAGVHVSPMQDIHCWLETRTHIIDCTTGDTLGESNDLWPPLIYWPKWRMPKHPREARAPGSILLWRNKKASRCHRAAGTNGAAAGCSGVRDLLRPEPIQARD